jgi:hypothetical protein
MTDNELTTKQLIKQVLTEDYTKENNKVFSLSQQTYRNFQTTKKYISFFRLKELDILSEILSDFIILEVKNCKYVEKENVIAELSSIINNFNPNQLPLKHCNNSFHISMEIGEARIGCNEDSDGVFFAIPWVNFISCRVTSEYYDMDDVLDINHVIEFDDSGKIIKIILHKM